MKLILLLLLPLIGSSQNSFEKDGKRWVLESVDAAGNRIFIPGPDKPPVTGNAIVSLMDECSNDSIHIEFKDYMLDACISKKQRAKARIQIGDLFYFDLKNGYLQRNGIRYRCHVVERGVFGRMWTFQ